MPDNVKIDVHHITRVEGHGNIKVDVKNGELVECRLEIVEAPRFFEAMIKGRTYKEASLITSRICGICSAGHVLASLAATEDAFNIKISEQEKLLRCLLNTGQHFESHVLHIYFLAIPDFVGAKSVLPLVNTHKDVVVQAIKLKKLGHEIGDMIGGRLIHPTATNVKAMTMVPEPGVLEEIIVRLEDAKQELKSSIPLLKSLKLPDYERETEYISLYKKGEYTFLEGDIYSSDSGEISRKDYLDVTNEYLCDHSTAKRTKHKRESYMVGALARFNNNSQWLSPDAKQTAVDLGLKAPCYNSYLNTVAQFVELVHLADEGIKAASALLNKDVKLEDDSFPLKAGQGVGAVEVPRGILFHDYTYDDKGILQRSNCIIPTGQNFQNIENDFRKLVPEIIDKSQDEIRLLLEMMVRAYDPCISCSAHILDIEFINSRSTTV
ncbi:MAG: Ni/Fe hydrogenase subunit alpha [bacterium]|nr:Ni/Fe hydrogenase subunit alpha [bacterium]